MLDSIYHVTLKLLLNIKTLRFCHIHATLYGRQYTMLPYAANH